MGALYASPRAIAHRGCDDVCNLSRGAAMDGRAQRLHRPDSANYRPSVEPHGALHGVQTVRSGRRNHQPGGRLAIATRSICPAGSGVLLESDAQVAATGVAVIAGLNGAMPCLLRRALGHRHTLGLAICMVRTVGGEPLGASSSFSLETELGRFA